MVIAGLLTAITQLVVPDIPRAEEPEGGRELLVEARTLNRLM